MPYKHIAAHLKKTELACRLHFHQLSHGSHRRKRTSSLSSSSSSGGSVRHSPPQYHLNGDFHEGFRDAYGYSSYGSMNSLAPYPMANTLGSRPPQHKMLLPKPRPMTPDISSDRLGGMRVNPFDSPNQQNVLDRDRLGGGMYDSRRNSFWSGMAQDYGTGVAPNHLDDMWRQQTAGHTPTPDESSNRNSALHSMLQPSPFPPYAPPMHSTMKDFGSMSLPSNVSASADRYNYSMAPSVSNYNTSPQTYGTAQPAYNPQSTYNTSTSYTNTPVMNDLSRSNTWSTGVSQPATAITSLLTEDKCPRHTDTRYCAGRCV